MSGSGVLPVALGDDVSLTVGVAGQVTGNVLANDSDADGDALAVVTVNSLPGNVGSTITGTYGSLVLGANGQYTYVLAANQANVQALTAAQTVTDVFHYTISDGTDHSVTTTTITNQNQIIQSEAFDSPAWTSFGDSGAAPAVTANVAAGPQGGASTADQMVLSGANKGLYAITNVSGQYTFSDLPVSPGSRPYTITATKSGYTTASTTATVGSAVPNLNISMVTGTLSGCVQVPPPAPANATVLITLSGTAFNTANFPTASQTPTVQASGACPSGSAASC